MGEVLRAHCAAIAEEEALLCFAQLTSNFDGIDASLHPPCLFIADRMNRPYDGFDTEALRTRR